MLLQVWEKKFKILCNAYIGNLVQCIHRKHCAMHTSKILCNAYSGALPEWEASGGSRVEIKIPHSSDFLTRLTLQQPPHHPTLGRTHFIAKHSHLLVLMFFMFYNSAWGNISSCSFKFYCFSPHRPTTLLVRIYCIVIQFVSSSFSFRFCIFHTFTL